jgi:hypothetical protein
MRGLQLSMYSGRFELSKSSVKNCQSEEDARPPEILKMAMFLVRIYIVIAKSSSQIIFLQK